MPSFSFNNPLAQVSVARYDSTATIEVQGVCPFRGGELNHHTSFREASGLACVEFWLAVTLRSEMLDFRSLA